MPVTPSLEIDSQPLILFCIIQAPIAASGKKAAGGQFAHYLAATRAKIWAPLFSAKQLFSSVSNRTVSTSPGPSLPTFDASRLLRIAGIPICGFPGFAGKRDGFHNHLQKKNFFGPAFFWGEKKKPRGGEKKIFPQFSRLGPHN